MRTVSAILRIYSQHLDPNEITQELGQEPSEIRRRGEVVGGRPAEENSWGLETTYEESEDLEEVVRRTLRALGAGRQRIATLQHARVVLWCAVFTDTPESTISLGPEAMREMSEVGAGFECSVYSSTFEEQ